MSTKFEHVRFVKSKPLKRCKKEFFKTYIQDRQQGMNRSCVWDREREGEKERERERTKPGTFFVGKPLDALTETTSRTRHRRRRPDVTDHLITQLKKIGYFGATVPPQRSFSDPKRLPAVLKADCRSQVKSYLLVESIKIVQLKPIWRWNYDKVKGTSSISKGL